MQDTGPCLSPYLCGRFKDVLISDGQCRWPLYVPILMKHSHELARSAVTSEDNGISLWPCR